MMQTKRRLVCLAAAIVLLATAQVSLAAEIELKNHTEEDFEGIYCVDEQGVTKQAAGELAGGTYLTVSSDKFPEYECQRIAVLLGGEGWQFFPEPEPGSASEINFFMEEYRPETDEYPSMLITLDGENYLSPAGVPLSALLQAMESGMNEETWKQEYAAPEVDPEENTDYVVSFADQSWSLHEDGLVFDENAESISLTAYFGNPTVVAIFEGLKSFGFVPETFKLDEQSASLEGATDADAKWEALDQNLLMAASGDGGDVTILFDSESFAASLELDLDNTEAVLVIERN
ncbi:MAG: hypothetical protein LBS53_05205 [Synergistaceae bacterium]|jgi:hypothetical protein|nr:hypothetical protein [Synergistaceae bacterium]